ncbi:GSCFA domain-containing protein [Azospirillum himalayense]|uniref:GSCFA domain-containing protein n=1 Tax=Azospirillum himalayense TaxID=654847 RepID=A0ABW0G6E0_9PROT
MPYTPYQDSSDCAFWSRSISRVVHHAVDPVVGGSFLINSDTRVATAGSCFAQHISRHLRSIGIEPYVTEWPHPIVRDQAADFHYGIYTARFGNIYTSRQLLQLFARAYGQFVPGEDVWLGENGKFYDPFRPGLPGGFSTFQEYTEDRESHFYAVREMFENLDVFVFTLGLTETWEAISDGAVFPSCPGAIAGTFDPLKHRFINLSVVDVVNDMNAFIGMLVKINPSAKIILTVSPVPLVATATKGHVLPATIYSKSVLRVAAQQISDVHSNVDYFPSYEIITGPQARGMYFAEDCRSVRPEGVEHVMKIFNKHYVENGDMVSECSEVVNNTLDVSISEAQDALNVICEELYNDSNLHPR